MIVRKPTAAYVGRLAGVSKWTVIRAFDPSASISEETRIKVKEAAKSVGYRPNLLARSLKTNRTNQVAILIDDFTNPHKLPVLAAVSLALQDEGKVLLVININQRFDQVDALIHARQRQVDGIILFANSLQDAILEEARANEFTVPMVILARESTVMSVPSVTTDTRASMIEIGEHLWSHGYRRPGFMTGPEAHVSLVSRCRRFTEFWQQRNAADVPQLSAGSYDRRDGENVTRRYLNSTAAGDRIDVLVCENDNLAMAAMDVMRNDFGLDVPKDIAVVGYDNIDAAAAPGYALTTYEQPVKEMTSAVLDILAGRKERQSIEIRGQLVIRDTA